MWSPRAPRQRWHSAVAIVLGFFLPGVAAGEPAVDSAKLSNLVRQDCGSCHGMTLQGGLGKPLTTEHLKQWNRDQLVHIILEGVPGTPMPRWRPLLTDSEASWIADALLDGALR